MTAWQDLLGDYGIELIAWAHKEGKKYGEGWREPMANRHPARYCVPCLKVDRKTAAVAVIDGAGYCRDCKPGAETASEPRHYTKLTPEQRAEVVKRHGVPATVLAKLYGVSHQTINNIRKEAEAEEAKPIPLDIPEPDPGPDYAEPEPEPETPFDEPEPGQPVKMTLELAVTHAQADRVWSSLDLDVKARIIASVVAERWAGLL